MKTAHFKTNIKCTGCVNTVTPFLKKVEGLEHWEVDLTHPDRIMTAELKSDETESKVLHALQEAGYTGVALD